MTFEESDTSRVQGIAVLKVRRYGSTDLVAAGLGVRRAGLSYVVKKCAPESLEAAA